MSRALGLSDADLWVPRRGFSTTRLVVDEDACSKAATPRSNLAGLDIDGRLWYIPVGTLAALSADLRLLFVVAVEAPLSASGGGVGGNMCL
jgi:hypothetical protein